MITPVIVVASIIPGMDNGVPHDCVAGLGVLGASSMENSVYEYIVEPAERYD